MLWDPSRRLIRSIRMYQAARRKQTLLAAIARKWWVIEHHFWSVITQAEIHLSTEIGGGLMIPHPNGVVINAGAVIGPNCLIFQQVTIGVTRQPGCPKIGGHVDIGAGAKVLGPVTIGDHAVIGANAVVVREVPAGAVVAGVPAVILKKGTSTNISKKNH